MTDAPQPTRIVILDEDEAVIAAVAVRHSLANMRNTYRANIRRGIAWRNDRLIEKYDAALDLYERLGGNPDEVLDIEAPPNREGE